MAKLSNTPPDRFPKDGKESKEALTDGAKTIRAQQLRLGEPSNIGPAPPARVYSRDYSKKDVDGDQHDDTLSPFLGNPLGF